MLQIAVGKIGIWGTVKDMSMWRVCFEISNYTHARTKLVLHTRVHKNKTFSKNGNKMIRLRKSGSVKNTRKRKNATATGVYSVLLCPIPATYQLASSRSDITLFYTKKWGQTKKTTTNTREWAHAEEKTSKKNNYEVLCSVLLFTARDPSLCSCGARTPVIVCASPSHPEWAAGCWENREWRPLAGSCIQRPGTAQSWTTLCRPVCASQSWSSHRPQCQGCPHQ